ncbi:septation ring formation regulator EzrA [Virgibacillus profundi]|uniref:Septation ring formation regulator EzrA n=1 Tax=Virgibacillus profundi TaxID=2024555 RepID=A0A2A2IG82_9BACI|nr:septation ring formation regulator EzrA [Virgibacillus profundi]PAV30140.1 septation ring formation regulator EzrA [Virgibacillus profundi]PXY54312.1 septation ring formation regulator EzrA [Virgibacillus profundi]
MAYTIGIILVIIALIIIGLILRKRVYDVVDKYEAWKMDIMGRNIASQLGRIKALNLSGETQVKFETWKERWEFIVTKELPDIEEYLFDAEEAADRYRFSKAKKTLNKVEQVLQSIENDIEKMLQELDQLMESEETSRKEIEELQPAIKSLRKQVSQNRYQYGKAEYHFDVVIDEHEEKLSKYHELTEAGDYSEAKELVDTLKDDIEELESQIQRFPEIFRLCKHDLPAQLDNLYSGLTGMKEDGYRVEHLSFEKEIRTYQERLLDTVSTLESGDMSNVEEVITDIEERIKEMYQLLEKEAIAKSYLETKVPMYQENLYDLSNTFYHTKEEVEKLKQAYYFEDSDMERYLSLEKTITNLKTKLEELSYEMENEDTAHSELREQVELGFQQIEDLQQKHEEFTKRIHNLRKDELEAKDKLIEMRDQLQDVNRKLKKSNIPGVPNFIWSLMETASNKNTHVIKALEKTPLDMGEVQQALNTAKNAVDQAIEKTDMMLEQAYLTEQVIQYANRYRSKYPILAAKLSESERLFRVYEYELSLEQAAKAIEEIEPGALKRIEEYQEAVN